MAFSRGFKDLLVRALELNKFALYVQPIVSLGTGQVKCWEILLRLPQAGGHTLPPRAFLGAAQKLGLMQQIDRWVLTRAVQIIQDLGRLGETVRLDVNLSPQALSDGRLAHFVQSQLLASAIDPNCLTLEITETAAIPDYDQARRIISTLRGLGCRFAIDDFGVGFSSFLNLKHLPVDFLKIDGGFIQNLPRDPVDQHLVQGMVQVARALGKQAVAEWVGDADTARLLRDYGVEYAQGYHFGRPQPVAAVWPQLLQR